jgi:hypothetical protein
MSSNQNYIIAIISLINLFVSCQNDTEEYLEVCIKKIYISCNDTLCTESHVIADITSHYQQDTIDVFMNRRRTRKGYTLYTLFNHDTVNISFAEDLLNFPPNMKTKDLLLMQYRLREFDYHQTGNIALSDSILTRKNVTKIINSPIYYYIEGDDQPKGSDFVELRITRSDTLQIIFQDETEYKYGDAYAM